MDKPLLSARERWRQSIGMAFESIRFKEGLPHLTEKDARVFAISATHASRWKQLYKYPAYGYPVVSKHFKTFDLKNNNDRDALLHSKPERYDPLYPAPENLYLPSGLLCTVAGSSAQLLPVGTAEKIETAVKMIKAQSYYPGVKYFLETYMDKNDCDGEGEGRGPLAGGEDVDILDAYKAAQQQLKKPFDLPLYPEFFEFIYRTCMDSITTKIRPDNFELVNDLWKCINRGPSSNVQIKVPKELIKASNISDKPLYVVPKFKPNYLLLNPYTCHSILLNFARVNDNKNYNSLKQQMMIDGDYNPEIREAILADLLQLSYVDNRYMNDVEDIFQAGGIYNPNVKLFDKSGLLIEIWDRLQDIAYNKEMFIPMVDAFNETILALGSSGISAKRRMLPGYDNLINGNPHPGVKQFGSDIKEVDINKILTSECDKFIEIRNKKCARSPETDSITIPNLLSRIEEDGKDIAVTLLERVLAGGEFTLNSRSFETMIDIVLNCKGNPSDSGDLQLARDIFTMIDSRFKFAGISKSSKMYDLLINESILQNEFKLASDLSIRYLHDVNVGRLFNMSREGLDMLKLLHKMGVLKENPIVKVTFKASHERGIP